MEGAYFSFAEFCRNTFGRKLYRIALDASMTCPNRDGTVGSKGCAFCSVGGSGDFAVHYDGQAMKAEDFLWFHKAALPGDFIGYFQAFTNTYAPIERLRFLFSAALSDPMFAGISIATRPDTMGTAVLDLLSELKKAYPEKFIWIELGLQTALDRSAELFGRGYRTEVYVKCTDDLKRIGIPFITHAIIGLPGETDEDLIRTIECINASEAAGVKLQLLHFLEGTEFGNRWKEDGQDFYRELSEAEYLRSLALCIGHLKEEIVIHRLTGDGNPDQLLAPLWSRNKKMVLNAIRHELKIRGIHQGCLRKN